MKQEPEFYPDTDGKCADCEHLRKCACDGLYCDLLGRNIDRAEEETCEDHKSVRRNYE